MYFVHKYGTEATCNLNGSFNLHGSFNRNIGNHSNRWILIPQFHAHTVTYRHIRPQTGTQTHTDTYTQAQLLTDTHSPQQPKEPHTTLFLRALRLCCEAHALPNGIRLYTYIKQIRLFSGSNALNHSHACDIALALALSVVLAFRASATSF